MIGILTFHRAVNYGAVLQCYALQKVLNEEGLENEVIDYRCKHIEKHYDPKPSVSAIHIKSYLKQLKLYSIKKSTKNRFEYFLKNNIYMSSPVDKNMLKDLSKKYTSIITGSDQVWNLSVSGNDTTYLLDFISDSTKKISYAASIGPKDINEGNKNTLKKYVNDYNVISVREQIAKESLKEFTDKKINVDVDPTVLLPSSEWIKMTNKSKLNYSNFIFVYIMQPSDILYNVAEKLAKKEGLTIYSISMVENSRKIGNDVKGLGVEDFLWMIKNAKYVVTNSFHGLMFSLQFQKNFYWAYQQGKHMSNPRFDMLIEQYGIDCRMCTAESLDEKCTPIDTKKVESTLINQRKRSRSNLKSYLGVENHD